MTTLVLVPNPPTVSDVVYCSEQLPCSETLACGEGGLGLVVPDPVALTLTPNP